MSDIRYCPRIFLTELIELYKSFPCLWRVKSREYNDRNKKNKAYQVLVEKFREVDSSATRDTVTKKINSLRSSYRKEKNKIIKLEQKGVDYKPSLWYFDLLNFLTDQDLPSISNKTLDDSNASCSESNWEFSEPNMETDIHDDESCSLMGRSNQSSECEYSRAYPSASEVTKGTKRSASEEALSNSKVMQLVTEKLRHTDDTISNRYESFGKYVSDELNNMPPEMVPYVKKVINLAIFEGYMKTLNATSSIQTCVDRKPGNCASGEVN